VLRGRIELIDARGIVRGARQLTGVARDCRELISSLALATSITLDPMSVQRRAEEETPVSVDTPHEGAPATTASEPRASGDPVTPVIAAPSADLRREPPPTTNAQPSGGEATTTFSVRAGPLLSIGESPAAAVGARIGAKARRGAISIAAELRGSMPARAASAQGGKAEFYVWGGAVSPCVEWGAFAGCALAFIGTMQTRGQGVPLPRSEGFFYAVAGARVEATIPVARAVAVVLNVDGVRVLTGARFYLQDREVWAIPPVTGAIGAAGAVHFP
jgi:hypothetical protein